MHRAHRTLFTLLAAMAAAILVAAVATPPHPAVAQARFAPNAFEDPVARQLYAIAYDRWHARDTGVAGYTALIRQRVAGSLRTPLRDRLFYSNEYAVRTYWKQGGRPVVVVLGNRTRHPGRDFFVGLGEAHVLDAMPYDEPFVPGNDPLFFNWDREQEIGPEGSDGQSLVHPLAEGSDLVYRFRSGDTITVTLADGRRVRAIEMQVIPLRASPFHITGTLWIEPESGGLVRAIFKPSEFMDVARDVDDFAGPEASLAMRLIPGVFKPAGIRLTSATVEYSLWEFEHWLPRSARMEVLMTAGVLKGRLVMDVSYEFASVVTASEDPSADAPQTEAADSAYVATLVAREGAGYELMGRESVARGKSSRFIVPKDLSLLDISPHLPPPVWEDAEGFASTAELEEYIGTLAEVPVASYSLNPWAFRYGWGSPEMIRYNRVEGLAAGLEFDAVLDGPYTLRSVGFFGLADGKAKLRVDLERSTESRLLALGGFHELRATDANAGHLRFGNSVTALFTGRDEGEYHRAVGVDLTWKPPVGERESFAARVYRERHSAVETRASFALLGAFDDDWRFRPNLEADQTDETGAELTASSWWGEEPDRTQGGVDFYGQAARSRPVEGERDAVGFFRASAIARARIPFTGDEWTGWRLGVEVGGGTTWGDAPAQRAWFLGSASTLRGYEPSVRGGSSFMRGRVEVAKVFAGVGGTVFYDVGWAGDRGEFDSGDVLSAAGLGITVMDGLIRADVANGLRGPEKRFRFYLYADAIL